jgi:excisionase family DNA binding protein
MPAADPRLLDGRLALTEPEAAQALGLSTRTLYSLRQRGEIRFKRVGDSGKIVYPVAFLREWLGELTAPAEAGA